MKAIVCFLMSGLAFAQTTSISGTWQSPDASAFTGSAVAQLVRPTVTNTCSTPSQVVAFKPVTIRISAGVMPSTSLYASDCLSTGPSKPVFAVALAGAGTGGTAFAVGNWSGFAQIVTGDAPQAFATVVRLTLQIPPLLTCYVVPLNIAAQMYTGATMAVQGGGTASKYISIVSGATPLNDFTIYSWGFHCVQPYQVTVYTSDNYMLYTAQWVVPVSGSPVDVTLVDLTQIGALPQ